MTIASRMLWTGLALFAVGSIAGATGCSGAASETDETTGTQAQDLSGPFTVTLAVPDPLSPKAPVLEGSNGVTVNSGSTVLSGTVVAMGASGFAAGSGAVVNDVWSRGTAHLSTGVHVRGTLHATSAVTMLGDVIQATDTNPPFDPPTTLTWTVTYPTGTPTNVSVPQNQSQTLAPGLYGTVSVGSNGTLNLAAGTYYLTSFSVSPRATVNVGEATGPVIVYVSTSATLGGSFTGVSATADLLVGYFGTASITVGDSSCTILSGTCLPFVGSIVAPSATVTLLALSAGPHSGFFAAPQLVLAANAKVQYRAPTAF
jgi:hypothetical protein